ncbi:MAG: multiheme c-type cytochrome [Campylobacterota bacterium]|nr:multiheme c-type cytochrome [Campylobacterota bacterium]
MKVINLIVFLFILNIGLNAKYLDTKSCAECHESIHYEHVNSMHHKSSLFKDEFHKKIKDITTPDKYDCALCHTPGANNLRALMTGDEQPNPMNKQESDGVSCFYCHQITKVLITKHKNINFYNYKADEKPKFFANLKDVYDTDKHKSNSGNEIYKNSQICMGCHGKKYNKFGVQICSATDEKGMTSDCIGCHMPKFPGGATKTNRKGREEYSSHEFLSIRDDDMVRKAVELKLNLKEDNTLEISIKNKMGHAIIMQPMRLKYVETIVERDGNIVWKNYDKYPIEDEQATFTRLFKDDGDHRVFPPFATAIMYDNNIEANGTKVIHYALPKLQKGDTIRSTWYSYVVRPSLASTLKLENNEYTKRYTGVKVELIVP